MIDVVGIVKLNSHVFSKNQNIVKKSSCEKFNLHSMKTSTHRSSNAKKDE